jgi:hypothetical protein
MAYDAPTVTEFRTRFPIFEEKEDALIQMLLDEAAGQVSTDWVEADYKPAIMYLAAHLLATDNSEEGDEVEIGSGDSQIASESFGGMSVSYNNGAGAAGSLSSNQRYGSTVYGRRYLSLLRANIPAIAAI